MKIIINCSQCGKEKVRYKSITGRRQLHWFCAMECKAIFYSSYFRGKNNPNYGNRWKEETKKKVSFIVKNRYKANPNMRWVAGTANRGKKFSSERCKAMSLGKMGQNTGKKHTEESKKKIGIASKKRRSYQGFNEKIRLSNEIKGNWIPLNEKSDWIIYFKEANWICKMFDEITNQTELDLLKKVGVFNCHINHNGVVRDHKFSRADGFRLKVFPEILRHPFNCQLLLRIENSKKRKSSISLQQLFDGITNYDKDWIEQKLALEKITEYNKGKYWFNKYKETT